MECDILSVEFSEKEKEKMDSKKIIKKYIMPNTFVRVGCVLFSVILAVTLVLGLLAMNAEVEEPVEFYPTETPTGTMAYIDVVGVSGWAYKYDDAVYYTVEDAEGYMYTVRLKDSQFNAMTAQQTYWDRASEYEPVPQPYRLVGYVQNATDDIKQNMSDAWGISTIEYEQYFGLLYLNATTSVGAENAAPWFIGALISGMFALLCIVFQMRASKVAKKCLKVLEERCLLDKAAQQLDNPIDHLVIGKNRGILTQDFIFGKGTGAVVAYSDVVWAFKQDQRRNFVVASSYLMAGTPWMAVESIIDLNRADREGYIGDALAKIAEKNPNALLGYTNENRKAYKAAVKAGK